MLINIQTTDKELKSLFDEFRKDFLSLNQKLDKIMANQADFKAVLGRIDAATNGVAEELKSLKDKIKTAGLEESVENEILASLTAQADKLEGIGKEEVPAPPVDPDPSPAPGPIEPPVEPA